MQDELFDEFMQSVRESVAISNGELEPSRVIKYARQGKTAGVKTPQRYKSISSEEPPKKSAVM